MKFHTGAVFGNRYTLGERIAVGGMGEVWEATDQVLGRIVAIKLLSPALADQEGFMQRFREEARNTAALSHPNIAAVYDYGEDAGANWLVMELVKGQPLSTIIAEQGALSSERTISIVSQAAHALQAAHDRGVIHRDVKPANILVKPTGEVKLTDFGISRATDAAPITRTGEVMGTAQYISPEQATGQAVSPKSDIYALGCVAYEMLTGRRPFDEGSPVATAMAHVTTPPPPLPSTVPPALAQVVMACLAKDAANRPASARALADHLRGTPTGGFPATAPMAATERLSPATRVVPPPAAPAPRRTTRVEEVPAEPKKNKGAAWAIAALLALLLLVGGFFLAQAMGKGGDDPAPTTTPTATRTSTPSETPSDTPSEEPSESTTTEEETAQVDAADYVGLPFDDAKRRLKDLGMDLQVKRENVDAEEPKDRVVGISPSGAVSRGEVITLEVSKGPKEKDKPKDDEESSSPAPDPGDPSTETAPPAQPTTPDAPSTGAQGNRGPTAPPAGPAGAGAGIPTTPSPETTPTTDPTSQE